MPTGTRRAKISKQLPTVRDEILAGPLRLGTWQLSREQQADVNQQYEDAYAAYDRQFIVRTQSVGNSRREIAAVLHDLCGVEGPLDVFLTRIADLYVEMIAPDTFEEMVSIYWRVLASEIDERSQSLRPHVLRLARLLSKDDQADMCSLILELTSELKLHALRRLQHKARRLKPASKASADADTSAIGRNIATLREECGWTVDQLSAKTGIDRNTILDHINKGTRPRSRTISEYCAAFSKQLGRSITPRDILSIF